MITFTLYALLLIAGEPTMFDATFQSAEACHSAAAMTVREFDVLAVTCTETREA